VYKALKKICELASTLYQKPPYDLLLELSTRTILFEDIEGTQAELTLEEVFLSAGHHKRGSNMKKSTAKLIEKRIGGFC
jgi:hypothetical protein